MPSTVAISKLGSRFFWMPTPLTDKARVYPSTSKNFSSYNEVFRLVDSKALKTLLTGERGMEAVHV